MCNLAYLNNLKSDEKVYFKTKVMRSMLSSGDKGQHLLINWPNLGGGQIPNADKLLTIDGTMMGTVESNVEGVLLINLMRGKNDHDSIKTLEKNNSPWLSATSNIVYEGSMVIDTCRGVLIGQFAQKHPFSLELLDPIPTAPASKTVSIPKNFMMADDYAQWDGSVFSGRRLEGHRASRNGGSWNAPSSLAAAKEGIEAAGTVEKYIKSGALGPGLQPGILCLQIINKSEYRNIEK